MSGIPSKCPKCGRAKAWKEDVNAFTSGIPLGSEVRVRFFSVRGIFSKPIKKKLGFYKVKYRCKNCGFEESYDLPH